MTESDSLSFKAIQASALLRRAEKYIEQAETLKSDDEKKTWLESEAAQLIKESRALSREVQEVAGVIHSKLRAVN